MRGRSFWAGIAVLAAGLIFAAGGAAAATKTVTLTVNSTADSTTPCTIANHKSKGTCTLRGAVLAADALEQDNTMFVIKLAAKTYQLSLGALDVDAASSNTGNLVQIVGATKTTGKGKHKTTLPASIIDGSGNAKPASVFEIFSPAQISTSRSRAEAATPAAGSTSTSALDLRTRSSSHNTSCGSWVGDSCSTYAEGGGIFIIGGSGGAVTLDTTTVTHNTGSNGGGIAYEDAKSLNGHAVLVMSSHIDKNTACDTFSNGVCIGDGDGGGIYNDGEMFTLDRSTVNGNVAGSRSVDAGDGGGIYQDNDAMQLNDTVVSGNVAGEHGGGIYDDETVDLVDSMVSHNAAGYEGGGIDSSTCSHRRARPSPATRPAGRSRARSTAARRPARARRRRPRARAARSTRLRPSAPRTTGTAAVSSADYEYPQFVGTTVTKNLAVSLAGDSTDCSSTDDYHGGQGGGVWTVLGDDRHRGVEVHGQHRGVRRRRLPGGLRERDLRHRPRQLDDLGQHRAP